MEYKDVIALARAGFNSQQIAQFAEEERMDASRNVAHAPAPAPEAPKTPEAPKAPEVPPMPAPSVNEAPAAAINAAGSQTDEILKGISQELASLKQSIQNNNIKQSNQPPRESVESILASIISPTYTHKEE